ncbi:MAG: hypothetical protein GTO40_07095, partial [Deltaproteobacteria bacterium]|nr:hypothetical protein [Deltaproteobacteria bacterium]
MVQADKSAKAHLSEVGGYIGQGTKVTGKFQFEGTTTIDGDMSGEIYVHG